MKNMPLVLVTWNDAIEMETGWHDINDITKQDPAVCKTVGWPSGRIWCRRTNP